MSLTKKLAATVPFAHLLGIRAESDEPKKEDKPDAARAESEDDDERKQREDESDEQYAKRMEELDDKDEKAKRAEEDKPEEDAEDDDDNAKAARTSERARCAKIIAHGIKNGCVNQAGVFAFDTGMTADQAISAMSASKLDNEASNKGGLSSRMAGLSIPRVTADAPAAGNGSDDPSKQAADAIIRAAAKARGEKI